MQLSIITVNLNNAEGLKRTLESVACQTFVDFELIVIDGGSNDSSLEIIKNFSSNITYWISEKDNGIYHAMNKGIKIAKGDYLLFLNSGDLLFNNTTLKEIGEHDFHEDLIILNIIVKTLTGEKTISLLEEPRKLLLNGMICHQAILHKRELFQTIGLYNEELKITADYEFLLKAFYNNNASHKKISITLGIYDDTEGISSYHLNATNLNKERIQSLKTIFAPEVVDFIQDQSEEILRLKNIETLYIGLLNSKLIQLTLKLINFKQIILNKSSK